MHSFLMAKQSFVFFFCLLFKIRIKFAEVSQEGTTTKFQFGFDFTKFFHCETNISSDFTELLQNHHIYDFIYKMKIHQSHLFTTPSSLSVCVCVCKWQFYKKIKQNHDFDLHCANETKTHKESLCIVQLNIQNQINQRNKSYFKIHYLIRFYDYDFVLTQFFLAVSQRM